MPLFKALVTVIYKVPDMSYAVARYKKLLGVNPNFEMPFYTGFTVGGGFELGLMPLKNNDKNRVVGYWEVGENISAAFDFLVKEKATVIRPVTDVGEGIKTAELLDPFGNPIGIIHNPLFVKKHKQFKFTETTDFSKCFLALETLTLHVDSLIQVAKWYVNVLACKPNFIDPTNYIGFKINGFSLGIMPKRDSVKYENLVTCYWLTTEKLETKKAKLIDVSENNHSLVGDIKEVGNGATLMELKDHTGIVYGVVNDPNFHFELDLLLEKSGTSIIAEAKLKQANSPELVKEIEYSEYNKVETSTIRNN